MLSFISYLNLIPSSVNYCCFVFVFRYGFVPHARFGIVLEHALGYNVRGDLGMQVTLQMCRVPGHSTTLVVVNALLQTLARGRCQLEEDLGVPTAHSRAEVVHVRPGTLGICGETNLVL